MASVTVMERFQRLLGEPSDIQEHLGLLRGLASDPAVSRIVEIGFRKGVSATALATASKDLHCIDIEPCTQAVKKLRALTHRFTFEQGDSHKVDIPTCDLLHIDSLHTYAHLLGELRRHHHRVSLWIAMHDTHTFASAGKDGSKPGLKAAIDDFLKEAPQWEIHLHLRNCNGMTVLKRARSTSLSP